MCVQQAHLISIVCVGGYGTLSANIWASAMCLMHNLYNLGKLCLIEKALLMHLSKGEVCLLWMCMRVHTTVFEYACCHVLQCHVCLCLHFCLILVLPTPSPPLPLPHSLPLLPSVYMGCGDNGVHNQRMYSNHNAIEGRGIYYTITLLFSYMENL